MDRRSAYARHTHVSQDHPFALRSRCHIMGPCVPPPLTPRGPLFGEACSGWTPPLSLSHLIHTRYNLTPSINQSRDNHCSSSVLTRLTTTSRSHWILAPLLWFTTALLPCPPPRWIGSFSWPQCPDCPPPSSCLFRICLLVAPGLRPLWRYPSTPRALSLGTLP